MKRSPMKRSGPIARRLRVKARRSSPRRVSVIRSQDYMDWLKDRKCVACAMTSQAIRLPIDPCHTVNNGAGSKGPDSSCIPLCRHHHDEMDGRLSTAITTKDQFAQKYGLDLAKEAEAHWELFQLTRAE